VTLFSYKMQWVRRYYNASTITSNAMILNFIHLCAHDPGV
jgi:hypothetical protein